MDSGSIRAPDVRILIDPPFLVSEVDWAGLINLSLETGLVWSLYDQNTDQLLYQSSEYTINGDGNVATFKHVFPAASNGDIYTITQKVEMVAA